MEKCVQIPDGMVKKTEIDSSQWYSVTGQKAMGTNWNTSPFKLRRYFFTLRLVEHWNRLLRNKSLSLHPWRYSNPNWTWSLTACCIWICFQPEGLPSFRTQKTSRKDLGIGFSEAHIVPTYTIHVTKLCMADLHEGNIWSYSYKPIHWY